jgi:hypothetical protein
MIHTATWCRIQKFIDSVPHTKSANHTRSCRSRGWSSQPCARWRPGGRRWHHPKLSVLVPHTEAKSCIIIIIIIIIIVPGLVGAEGGHSGHVLDGGQAGDDGTILGELTRAQRKRGGAHLEKGITARGIESLRAGEGSLPSLGDCVLRGRGRC